MKPLTLLLVGVTALAAAGFVAARQPNKGGVDLNDYINPPTAPPAGESAAWKKVCWWAEGLAKLLLFLSFWYVSSEVIDSPVWQRHLDRGARVVAAVTGLCIFAAVAVAVHNSALPPPEPLPAAASAANPIQEAIRAVMRLAASALPVATAVVMGYMVALFGGGAVYYLTRSALLGWKDQLGRDTRLTVGAVLFIAGGLLDLAAWFFKPE